MDALLVLSIVVLLSAMTWAAVLLLRRRARRSAASARETAEETLRGAEARMRVMLEQLPAVVWTTDRRLRFTSSLGAGLAALGLQPNQAVGLDIGGYFQNRDESFEPIDAHRRALAGESVSYEVEWGGQSYHSVVEPLRDSRGEVIGVVGVAFDITELRRSLEALRASEEKFRQLFEQSQDTIFISTPEGRIVDINPAGVELFGFESKEELLAVDIGRELYLDPFQRRAALERLSEEGALHNFELHLRRKDGSRLIALESTTAVRDPAGKVVAYRGILRDVTQERALEQQLRQSQRMEAVGRMAGGIAHDFNNLLTVISGRSDLLRSQLPAGSALVEEVDEIKAAGDRAAALTRQLLILSRRQIVSPVVVDLNEVLVGVESLLRRSIGEAIDLVIRRGDGLRNIRVDPGQMEQVLLNLTLNARDAMPKGGRLTVETSNLEVAQGSPLARAGFAPGPHVRLRISDTGVGIEEEILEHIFEPFFSTKDPSQGTGLGLSTVYGIVEQAGGHVRAESTPGKGSTFDVILPAAVGEAVAIRSEQQELEVPGGRETVLLVEDEEAVRHLLRSYLASRGYRVLEAASGEEALRISRRGGLAVDVLVTDVVMPGIEGSELARRLRARWPELEVLFISGYRDAPADAKGLNEAGRRRNFLQKPFSTEELARALRGLLDAV